METSKQSRVSEDKDGVDMISKLQDPVLRLILAGLPTTEEVIRTSILSTRWRYLWTLVPSIDIDYSRGLNPNNEFKKDKFEEFVSWVLVNDSLDLDSFRLSCANYYDMSTMKGWIDAAITRNIKILDLKFCPTEETEDIELPHCLITSGSLEVLKLFLFGSCLRMPNCRGVSVLRVLELNNVKLNGGGLVTNFLKSCPLLEDLKFKNVVFARKLDSLHKSYNHGIEISCPKLVFLELTGYIGNFYFIIKGLDSLKKAVINPNGLPSELMRSTLCELLNGISHVESLSLNPFIILKCLDAVSLPNVKTLELITSIDDFPINEIVQIVENYPHMEALHLIIQDVFSYQRKTRWRPDHWKLEEVKTRRILTRYLKRVEFLEFNGETPSLDLSRLLLLYGNALKEMVFSWGNKDKYPRKSMETMKSVSNFHKASSTVKLITLLKELKE